MSKNKNSKKFSAIEFVKRYRAGNWNYKIKALSKLSKKNNQEVIKLLTSDEIKQYKKKTSALIERRFACIERNRKCLDAVTAKNPNLKEIREKYYNVDLSIPVYTIKAIINAYEGASTHITKDDGKYSKNAHKYYRICLNYWDKITDRWDTHTGVYSKEEIEKKEFSEYHINANKVKTILPQLSVWKKSRVQKPSQRYNQYRFFNAWDYTPEHEKWYHIDINGYKSRVGGAEEFQMFLESCAKKRKLTSHNMQLTLKTYTTYDGKTFTNLDELNYKYLLERDEMLKLKKY